MTDLHLADRTQSGGNERRANNRLQNTKGAELTMDLRSAFAISPRDNLRRSCSLPSRHRRPSGTENEGQGPAEAEASYLRSDVGGKTPR